MLIHLLHQETFIWAVKPTINKEGFNRYNMWGFSVEHFLGEHGGRYLGELQGTRTAIVRQIASWKYPPARHSQAALQIYSSTERWVSKDCISWKIEKTVVYFYEQVVSARIRLRIRDVVKPFYELRRKFLNISSTWESRKRKKAFYI